MTKLLFHMAELKAIGKVNESVKCPKNGPPLCAENCAQESNLHCKNRADSRKANRFHTLKVVRLAQAHFHTRTLNDSNVELAWETEPERTPHTFVWKETVDTLGKICEYGTNVRHVVVTKHNMTLLIPKLKINADLLMLMSINAMQLEVTRDLFLLWLVLLKPTVMNMELRDQFTLNQFYIRIQVKSWLRNRLCP